MSNTFYDQDIVIKNRDIIYLKFRIEYPLHIGDRQEGVVKKVLWFNVDGRSVPIIPAESFKGVFRHLATKFAKKLLAKSNVGDVVKCHNKDKHVGDECTESKYIDEANAWLNNYKILRDIEVLSGKQLVEIYLSYKCPICKLFGSRVLASRLLFYDITFETMPRIDTYTSTSIDRRTRTVSEGKLFDIEYIPPDERYVLETKIIVNNVVPGTYEAVVLATTLRYIVKYGLQIGGAKSRGYGLLIPITDGINWSYVKSLKLEEPKSEESILNNINALLLKDEAVITLKLSEYILYLMKKVNSD